MKTSFRILFFFLLVMQIGFAQWYQQTSGTTANLNAVQFIDINNGWAVGDSGIILHTTNGGQEWLKQMSGTTFELFGISYIDQNRGVVIGFNGTILITTNGGSTWMQQISGTNECLKGASFIDNNNGFVVGASGTILKTSNGGLTWVQNNTQFEELNGICFSGNNIGWAVGAESDSAIILKTTDGGNNWLIQSGGSMGLVKPLTGVSFTDVNNGTVVGRNGTILRTTDGGSNWTHQTSGTDWTLVGVSFTDAYNGTVVGHVKYLFLVYGIILRTNDGGLNWNIQDTTGYYVNGVYCIDSNCGYIVGSLGTILKTTNGGVTFIDEDENNFSQPTEFALLQNYPNPFNPSTIISYQLPTSGKISLKVYDLLGREVATLVDEEKQAGSYEVEFKSTVSSHQLASGVYFYQLKAGDYIQIKKMILIK